MTRLKTYIYLLILIILSGCAQIGTLSGGEKDTDPPEYVKSNPLKQGRNFTGDKITITFDEFFVLDNLNAVFLASPPLLEKPDFNIKRKSLVVKLNEKLKDTTTYTLLFGNAIKDFHAGNILNDFRFVFSTGETIDTMEVSGKVIDAKTHEGQEDLLVMLYKNHTDSAPIKEKPYYIAKTDTAGNFNINFIKPGKYKIFALKDNDANLNFNLASETIAFIDSFIIPRTETETKIDSFKAGSIIHIGEKDSIGDTLKRDTVMISKTYIYSPKNILLFSFKEDKHTQYLINSERNSKGKCVFQYAENTDSIKISGFGFDLNVQNSFVEKQDTGRTIITWLKDKDLCERDTLHFILSYFNKDSLYNPVQIKDTVVLTYNFDNDTIKKQTLFTDNNPDLDYFKDFTVENESPIQKIDTSHIKLFLLLDTLVSDTKKQALLKSFRPTPDTLIFALKRPFANHFYAEALNFDTVSNWYSANFSQSDTMLTCTVTDKNIFQKDTLEIILHYDNAFFKRQLQEFSDTLHLPLFKQNLISAERPAPDTLIFNFKKQISAETTVNLAKENSENWYQRLNSENKNQLKLSITDKNFIEEDTLLLKIRTLDYDNTLGDKIYFEYVKNMVFKHKRQKINSAVRLKKNQFTLIFNKTLFADIIISSADSLIPKNPFTLRYNKLRDTVICDIQNQSLINNDTLKIAVSYKEKIKHTNINHTDTLSLIYKKPRRRHKKHYQEKNAQNSENNQPDETTTAEKKETVSIEIPIKYKFVKDSVNERFFNIKYPWKEGLSYILKLDSFAAEDYYGNFSEQKSFKFKIRSKDEYGKIILNISNIKRISDSTFYNQTDTLTLDSVANSKLPTGQLILNLYDKNNELLKTDYLKTDTIIIYENIVSGNYHLEMIYDKNENQIWDTGNYLKHIQPERILYFPNDIIIKPNWDNSVDIKIKALKYN